MESTRAIALLWRASADPAGACLWTLEDRDIAPQLAAARLGYIEKRKMLPHQLQHVPDRHEWEWLEYFVISDAGRSLWATLNTIVSDCVRQQSPDPTRTLIGDWMPR